MESTDAAELTEAQRVEWRVALESLNKFMKRSSNHVVDFPFFHIIGRPIDTQGSPDGLSKIMHPYFAGLNLGCVYDLSKEQAEQEHITLPAPIERPDQIEIRQEHDDGTSRITVAATRLYVSDDESRKLLCDVAGEIWEVSTLIPTTHEGPFEIKDVRDAVTTRNRAWEAELAKGARPKSSALATIEFPIHTSQEIDALICGAADGKRGAFWRNELTRGARVWEHKKHAHRLEVACGSEFDTTEVSFETIEKLTSDQDADFALALFYVAGVLCPPPHCPRDRPGEGWIELNDVMGKIGWFKEKPNAQKREQLRHKLWRFLVFGEEVSVIGSRGGVYKDKQSGRKIETYIESPVWKLLDKERPVQTTLFPELTPAPLAVKIVVSDTFQRIFSNPQFAQYMPLGELLGAIPPNKVAGDWARGIGLTLAKIWRCKPYEARSAELRISRRELLTHFAPKTQSCIEIFESDKPKRAVVYYREALNILLEVGLIGAEGDAAKHVTPDKMLEPYGRKGWTNSWLDGACGLQPGLKWEPVVEKRADARKPHALKAKKQVRDRAKKVS